MGHYTLCEGKETLRKLSNLEGLKLSALFCVANGDRITWQPAADVPCPQAAVEYGFVNGKRRFHIFAN